MEASNNSEVLHYKRGIYYIDKLINLFPNGKYNEQSEKEFAEKDSFRFRSTYIGNFDLNNFMFLCSIALLGLNKEAIENSINNKGYKCKIDYSKINFNKIPASLNSYISSFDNTRTVESDYDDWLSINNIKILPNFDYNYLFNVRNGFMHSEYNFDLFESYSPLIANVNNSNYTKFSAKIYMPKYYEFIKHYFSNDSFFGLVDKLYMYDLLEKNMIVTNDEQLKDYIVNKININKLTYDNKEKANDVFEKIIHSHKNITESKLKKYNVNSESVKLSNDDIEQVFLTIKSYYGNEFYNLSNDKKEKIIISAIKYRLDTKSVISSWLLHFYRLASGIIKGIYYNDDFTSLFAMKATLLTLKSYLILYRIQNKELAKFNIDYNLINKIDFDYELNYYNDYKLKLINKGIIVDEEEYKTRYFSEIFRDALAHGNVETIFKEENNLITQYFVFKDKWKTKERTITISMENLEKFLFSECFGSQYLNSEIEKNKVKCI